MKKKPIERARMVGTNSMTVYVIKLRTKPVITEFLRPILSGKTARQPPATVPTKYIVNIKAIFVLDSHIRSISIYQLLR